MLTNKGIISSNVIILEENGKMISDEPTLVETFNSYYINILESTTGNPPMSLGDPSNPSLDKNTVLNIIELYKDHPIIVRIHENISQVKPNFSFPLATVEEVTNIVKNINIHKGMGNDKIPPKLVKPYA